MGKPLEGAMIPYNEPHIIHKLGIDSETWLETVGNFTDNFYTFIGPIEKLEPICHRQFFAPAKTAYITSL